MLSKSFFGYTKPAFRYELLSTTLPQPIQVPIPETVTLLLPRELDAVASDTIKVGARGQNRPVPELGVMHPAPR
jgi:hypothetical protein